MTQGQLRSIIQWYMHFTACFCTLARDIMNKPDTKLQRKYATEAPCCSVQVSQTSEPVRQIFSLRILRPFCCFWFICRLQNLRYDWPFAVKLFCKHDIYTSRNSKIPYSNIIFSFNRNHMHIVWYYICLM